MWTHRFFFAALYFLQGSVLAYISNFQKPFLRDSGVSLATIGLFSSLLLVPFIAKALLGILSDRVSIGSYGGRKPYMLIGLGLCVANYFALAWINPASSFPMFAVISWFAVLGLALFDTCADGWAIDVATGREQGAIQSSMVSGKAIGFILMSTVIGRLIAVNGHASVFWMISGLSAVIFILVALVPYGRRDPGEVATGGGHDPGTRFWKTVLRRPFFAFGAFGVTYSIASFGTDGLVTLYLSEARSAGTDVIGTFGTYRGVGALAGAITFGVLVTRVRLERLLFVGVLILGVGCLIPNLGLGIRMSGFAWGACWGFQETAYVTLAMRFAVGQWSATIFAVAMIFSNLGTSIGEAVSAPLVSVLGFSGVFFSLAGIAWLAATWIPWASGPGPGGREAELES